MAYHKLLGSSSNPEQLALTWKGLLLTLVPVLVAILASLHITLDPNDLIAFINTLFGIITAGVTLYGLGRKIFYQVKK